MFTEVFVRLPVGLVMEDTLMTLRLATKAWKRVVDTFIDEGMKSGVMIVHGEWDLRARVVFLLNITKVGDYACYLAVNVVVVDLPEGVKIIGHGALWACTSLTAVSFPATLTSIGSWAFYACTILENVDLLHTNLQELGEHAFYECFHLKSMTILDLLQTNGYKPFRGCFHVAPFKSRVTSKVVAYLRSKQNN
ncbi:hypothetical protein TrLO_g14367 [Triparma laevis f. longispina]|uniref:Uncharacterized protein n=1 Tax=Triparma laevis f. longispina TaxID=1714387 RepID=A0A9W7FTD0_9STRA|nr:hypothetical protein TrLO_g14367 [Triparma laevis f. longispina]